MVERLKKKITALINEANAQEMYLLTLDNAFCIVVGRKKLVSEVADLRWALVLLGKPEALLSMPGVPLPKARLQTLHFPQLSIWKKQAILNSRSLCFRAV